MPHKVWFDNKGNVALVEELRCAVFYLPEGEEIDHIDLSVPEEPVAVMKPHFDKEEQAPQVVEAEEIQPDQEQEA